MLGRGWRGREKREEGEILGRVGHRQGRTRYLALGPQRDEDLLGVEGQRRVKMRHGLEFFFILAGVIGSWS